MKTKKSKSDLFNSNPNVRKAVLITIISNPLRRYILGLLVNAKIQNKDSGISLMDLKRNVKELYFLDYHHKAISNQVKFLEEYGFVELEKKSHEKGQPVIVKLGKNYKSIRLIYEKEKFSIV